jgi:flagellum-specific peptidoglycan hydrolase FlgJ
MKKYFLFFSFLPLFVFGQKKTDAYIEKWKEECVLQMKEHGIPASITMAQAILESGNGASVLATKANNHFGIKCGPYWTGETILQDDDKKGECFRVYPDAKSSFEDHSIFLKKERYASLFELSPTDYKGWAYGLKKCGYATNPQYPQKLIELIEQYHLYDLDKSVEVVTEDTKKKIADLPSLETAE